MRCLLSAILVVVTFCGFTPQQKPGLGSVTLAIDLRFLGEPLVLGRYLCHSAHQDSLSIDVWRFYISAVEFKNNGVVRFTESNSYHLVDAELSNSQTFVIHGVPIGDYDAICFNIGTDSLTNVSGAMGGDLDPTLGMYWAWNTGYINCKIEGRSNACKTLHHAFEFHLGGYMPPNQTVRKLQLPVEHLRVVEDSTAPLRITSDLFSFFSHIRLDTTNKVMIPSRVAAQLADNFAKTFTVQ
jgi:hypothetical protein